MIINLEETKKKVQIGQLTKPEMTNLNEMQYTDEMDEMRW